MELSSFQLNPDSDLKYNIPFSYKKYKCLSKESLILAVLKVILGLRSVWAYHVYSWSLRMQLRDTVNAWSWKCSHNSKSHLSPMPGSGMLRTVVWLLSRSWCHVIYRPHRHSYPHFTSKLYFPDSLFGLLRTTSASAILAWDKDQ